MQTLTPSWQKQLSQLAAQLPKADAAPRVAILGVGSELNGDDAAGVYTARALQRYQARGKFSHSVLVIDAGLAPENFSGRLRQFGPHLVILIDAAHMGGPAGEIRLLAWEQAAGLSASTHTLPLSMLSSFITTELGCQVALLGIQPQQIGPGQPCSLLVRNAVRRLARGLARTFQSL
jgi:hydrogenase 3 maturation protease